MDGAKALLTLFALGISLVWILVPFAIFAVRNLLRGTGRAAPYQ
jgi:hypothetical protein